MAEPLPESMLRPRNPERICWGCDQFCPADTLGCANGSIRTPHPIELFGDDWLEWEQGEQAPPPRSRRSCAAAVSGVLTRRRRRSEQPR